MSSVFKSPQCFIFTEPSSGRLQLNHSIVDEISSVKKRINAVAIAGLYRTGKSYLLTRLAGAYKGFPLGSSIQSKTKGIWVWCVDHPVYEDQMLLLLDTEGLGDIRKGDQNNDNQIFTLATLLSSTLIYNTFGAFDDNALNNLNFITEMSRNIRTGEPSQHSSDSTDFDVYFPEFILTLRDFTLDLEADGDEMTPDEYLEYCLKAEEGDSEEVKRFNEPRLCLRKYFKRRKCFVFGCPTSRSKLKRLENMSDADLNPDFVEDTQIFLEYVHTKAEPLKLANGTPVSGRMYTNLAISYVEAIRQGAIPCIKSALQSMAMLENERAVEEAINVYSQEMRSNVQFPTEDEQALRDSHLKSKNITFDLFLKRRVLDDDDAYKKKLDNLVTEEYKRLVLVNEEKSKEICEKALRNLHARIAANIQAGVYAVQGGYKLYDKDRNELKQQYGQMKGLGVMKDDVFVAYTHLMKNESEAVLKSDQTISEREKSLHLEREAKRRAEEREAMVQKKIEEAHKEMLELKAQQKKEYEKLQAVHANEMKNERARMDDVVEKRMKEISRLQSENLKKAQEQHEKELGRLQAAQKERDNLLKGNLDNLNKQLDALNRDNKAKEEALKKIQEELDYEKELRRKREEEDDDCVIL